MNARQCTFHSRHGPLQDIKVDVLHLHHRLRGFARAGCSTARSVRPFLSSSMATAEDNVVTLMSCLSLGGLSIFVFRYFARRGHGHFRAMDMPEICCVATLMAHYEAHVMATISSVCTIGGIFTSAVTVQRKSYRQRCHPDLIRDITSGSVHGCDKATVPIGRLERGLECLGNSPVAMPSHLEILLCP
jgi:hypothetical protein